jgi:hypothetical protein
VCSGRLLLLGPASAGGVRSGSTWPFTSSRGQAEPPYPNATSAKNPPQVALSSRPADFPAQRSARVGTVHSFGRGLPITYIRPLSSGRKPRDQAGITCFVPPGYAVAGLTNSNARCATAALAGSPSLATCTVGNANLMPFSSKAFLIIA